MDEQQGRGAVPPSLSPPPFPSAPSSSYATVMPLTRVVATSLPPFPENPQTPHGVGVLFVMLGALSGSVQ